MVNDASAPTPQAIQELILKNLEEAEYRISDWRVSGPIKTGRTCHVFRARTTRFKHDVAVKVFRPETLDVQTFKNHVKLLHDYWSGMQNEPDCRVPRPIAAFDDQMILLMEWISVPRLKDSLKRSLFPGNSREAGIRAAGRWLRRFHEVKGVAMQPLNLKPILARIESMRSRSKGGSPLAREPESFRHCYKRLCTVLPRLEGLSLPHARLHGDFNPNNVFYGSEGIFGFDFFSQKLAPVTDDICRFLVYLQVYNGRQFAALPARILMNLESDRNLFHQGYGRTDPDYAQSAFSLLFLAETLRRWASIRN